MVAKGMMAPGGGTMRRTNPETESDSDSAHAQSEQQPDTDGTMQTDLVEPTFIPPPPVDDEEEEILMMEQTTLTEGGFKISTAPRLEHVQIFSLVC